MQSNHLAGILVLLTAAQFGCSAPGQRAAGVLPHYTFENGTDGWFAYESNAKVKTKVTQDTVEVKEGSGALKVKYEFVPNEYGSAVVAVKEDSMAKMQTIRFWLKSDLPTAVGVVLSERTPNGGAYSASFWSPENTWQRIELAPNDFALNEGPADSPDPNGRLDADRIQGIGIIDLGQYFQTLMDPDLPIVIDRHAGSHKLYVDDFEVSAEAAPKRDVIGRLDRGFLTWITMGGSKLSLSKKQNPLGAAALEWAHEQPPGKYAVISHGFNNLDFRGADGLSFDAASQVGSQLVIYIEQRSPGKSQGPRYKATLDVPGSSKKVHKTIRFSDFEFDPAGPAGSAKPDAGKLKSISLLDVTPQPKNTIWLSEIAPN